jgi:hypothetical protein
MSDIFQHSKLPIKSLKQAQIYQTAQNVDERAIASRNPEPLNPRLRPISSPLPFHS